jgi:hypothetical protein
MMPHRLFLLQATGARAMQDVQILAEAALAFVLLILRIPQMLFKLLVTAASYHNHLGPREAALAEASHGAAMIVLPVLVLLRYGGALPSWSPLAALALMICGGFRLFNGAKFSIGWRDPKLIARAAVKIALAVLLFRAIATRQFDSALYDFAALLFRTTGLQFGVIGQVTAVLNALLSLVGWWMLVTGITKLVLVLRGFPPAPWDVKKPDMVHGKETFTKPDQAAEGLKK